MQVFRVELAEHLQRVNVGSSRTFARHLNQSTLAKFRKRTIYVHRRQAQWFTQFGLGQRQLVMTVVDETNGFERASISHRRCAMCRTAGRWPIADTSFTSHGAAALSCECPLWTSTMNVRCWRDWDACRTQEAGELLRTCHAR